MIGYDNLTVITELTKRFFIRAAKNQHNLDAASSRLTVDHRLPADRVYRPHEYFDREGMAEKRDAGKPGRISPLFTPPNAALGVAAPKCRGLYRVTNVADR
jgi:hypothetical protein